MKKYLHSLLLLAVVILVGCQEKTTTKTVYPPGTNPGTTTCTGIGYYTTPGCQGYQQCQSNPNISPYCSGSTTGTTNGGTTGGTNPITICSTSPSLPICQTNYCSTGTLPHGCIISGGVKVNCYLNPTIPGCGTSLNVTVPPNPNWGVFYPVGEPVGSCSSTYVPAGLDAALETRKGTITIAGKGLNSSELTEYDPYLTSSNDYYNTSPLLTSFNGVKQFYLTDAIIKARIKVHPEPYAAGDTTVCKGRNTGSYWPGYTKLQYEVHAYGVMSNGGVQHLGKIGDYTTGVNNCSPTIDISASQELYPRGVYLAVRNIKENKGCNQDWWAGWQNCNQYRKVRSQSCVRFEIEVAADGTKTFN